MDFNQDNYPPNPTTMNEDQYKAGVDVLFALLEHENNTEIMTHIEKVLTAKGVDASLYLLYYGHHVKQTIEGYDWDARQHQAAFRTLLQTACSIGALIGKMEISTIEKLDKL